jgi:eukaryotic-like serine/threonine-protein kinase
MALTVGTRLGPYEIISAIGTGGMGEVYRARDPRIGRDVAVKVLPTAFSEDQERLRRFQQEAHSAGVLNHPNILAVHDVGSENGAPYIVSELLEGETLREKLGGGPLSSRRAIDYSLQIANGLSAAHEKGITHRDLKPENIFVTKDGRIKIFDFGLAKLTEKEGAPSPENSALQTVAAQSNPGTVLGTMGYMSPEQVRGLPVDWRSDIFTFGAILYEMLTGKRAFTGNTQADTITAILQKDPPDVAQSNPDAPPAADKILRHCLEKEAARRFQSAQDVAFALESLSGFSDPGSVRLATPSAQRAAASPKFWMTIAAICAIAAIVTLLLAAKMRVQKPGRVLQLSIVPPAGTTLSGWPVISPDGGQIIFPATDTSGRSYLWLRSLDSSESRQLPGTEDALQPFWSPDNKWIAFFSPAKLKKIQLPDGPTQVLCNVGDPRGGAWNQENTILFAPNPDDGLSRIPSSGGNITPVTSLRKGESGHRWPIFLPNGRDFLFYIFRSNDMTRQEGIYFGSLDTSELKPVATSYSGGIFIPPSTILFQQGTTLMAQSFDLKERKPKGDPIPITDQVTAQIDYSGSFGFSADANTLACVRGNLNSRFVWFDRTGRQVGSFGDPAMYQSLSLSPDGKRVVSDASPNRAAGSPTDLWIVESSSGMRSRFTFNPLGNLQPVWSPDITKIAFGSNPDGPYNVFVKNASGTGKEQQLFKSDKWVFPVDWSMDGTYLLYELVSSDSGYDLWAWPMSGNKATYPIATSQSSESQGKFSPDGQFVAYTSDETGRPEIYVQTFPDPSHGRWQISTAGAVMPRWSKDGKELFYLALDRKLMVVDTSTGFQSVTPQTLFANVPVRVIASNQAAQYAVSENAQRFLILTPLEDRSHQSITIIANWQNLLKQ